MNLKKLLAGVLVLGGVYNQSHSMDKDAWQTDLYQAIVHGNVGQLKTCIARDATFNHDHEYKVGGYALPDGRFFVTTVAIQGMGQTAIKEFFPLHLACKHNQLAIVRFFVEERNAVINGPADDDSAILCAANEHHVEMVQYLLSKGAQVNPAWIIEGEKSLARMAKDDPRFNTTQRMIYLFKGGKIVCGVPMPRLNIGIIIAGVAVCAAAGKYFYDRYCASYKKNALDDDEVDAQGENEAVVSDQTIERA